MLQKLNEKNSSEEKLKDQDYDKVQLLPFGA
jgi:hypothetical protein